MTNSEFDILVALMRRAGRVVHREALLAEAGRDGLSVSERTVDVHVSNLRKKFGNPKLIEARRGLGYVFGRDPMDRTGKVD